MRRAAIAVLILILLAPRLRSQLRDPVVHTDTSECIIPFSLVNKLIVLQASADTSTGNFIFDTGSPGLVLNNTYFRGYPITTSPHSSASGISGTGDATEQTTVANFRMGTLRYNRVQADLLPLGHLEESRGIKILGLVGVSMFKECEMQIDYLNSVIRLRHISKRELKAYRNETLEDTAKFFAWPFEMRENRILLNSSIGKKKLFFTIDYAAETSVIDAGLSEKVLDSVEIVGRILLTGTGVRKIEALTGALSGLKIENVAVPPLQVIVTPLENTCFGALNCINGVLGFDYLSSGIIAINFRKRILYKSK